MTHRAAQHTKVDSILTKIIEINLIRPLNIEMYQCMKESKQYLTFRSNV